MTLSRMFYWCGALVNVKPDTLIRWHAQGLSALLALEVHANADVLACLMAFGISFGGWPPRIRSGGRNALRASSS